MLPDPTFECQPYDQPSDEAKSHWTEHKTRCNCYPECIPQLAAIPHPGSPNFIGEEELLLDVEEILHVANEIQLDPEFLDVIAQVKEAIHSNVEASRELIVKEVDSRFGRNGSYKM